MREHDDREQFLAGIDLVLAGITALGPAEGGYSTVASLDLADRACLTKRV
ncbi:hypothetical protein [Streptomyces milbemycinicus]|uniref:Uncharacterized protein n=1 Tax=Streptomyces milbemycinicus TaxID=476552 RepID=A0ABW8LDT5_9ACTN